MDALAAIRTLLPVDIEDVTPIVGGWSHWTFDVRGRWIFQFPRSDDVAANHRFSDALAEVVEFEVPIQTWSGRWADRPFFGYEKLSGRPLDTAAFDRSEDLSRRLASMLSQLHSFDADRARTLLGVEGTRRDWGRRYENLESESVSRLAGIVSPETMRHLGEGFAGLRATGFEFTPVPVHGDLGADHILIDDGSDELVGLIDFEDATVGDPAIDFVGFWITLGSRRTQQILTHYPHTAGPDFIARLKAYYWIGSLHAVLHGLDRCDEEIIADGIQGLTQRLVTRGGDA